MNGTLLRRSWLGFWSLCSQKSASGMSWTCFPAPNYATKNPWLWTETKQQIWGSWKMGSIFKQVTGVWSLDIIDFNRLCFCLPCQVAVKVAAEKDVRFWAQFEELRSVTTSIPWHWIDVRKNHSDITQLLHRKIDMLSFTYVAEEHHMSGRFQELSETDRCRAPDSLIFYWNKNKVHLFFGCVFVVKLVGFLNQNLGDIL